MGSFKMQTLSTGKTAPDFQLATTTGMPLSLQEVLARGPVLLAFFKVSCPTCHFTFPFLERLHRQLRGQGVQILGVAQDSAQDAARFGKTFGVTFPIVVDAPAYKISRAYGLEVVPSLFLVQPDGQIDIASEGFSKADLLAIQRSLARLHSTTPPALFLPTERIPEYKPG
jgi:peroxiredoxin